MSATATTALGETWALGQPRSFLMDPTSGTMYAPIPASQYFSLPQRNAGPRFFTPTLSSPSNLATTPATTSNTSVLAAPRRKRASKPKVRTGCETCKIRRVKCGEERPSCLRCTSTGRKCDGYKFPKKIEPEPVATSTIQQSPVALSPPAKRQAVSFNNLILPTTLTQPFEGTIQEKRLFHRFQVRTAPSFIGGSELPFWTQIVLRLGQQEPVVRNAIIALSSLHEDYQIRSGKYDAQQLLADPSYRQVTLLYGKALRQLNQRLNEPTQETAKIAIICSILFACFEVLRRNNMAAVVHYQQGMRELMRQMSLPSSSSSASSISDHSDNNASPTSATSTTLTVSSPTTSSTNLLQPQHRSELDTLLLVFARYDIQACTFSKDRAEPLSHPTTTHTHLLPPLTPPPNPIPPSTPLPQILSSLDTLLITTYQLTHSDLRLYRYLPASLIPQIWLSRQSHTLSLLTAWQTSLDTYFSHNPPTTQNAHSILGLRLQLRTSLIELSLALSSPTETAYDAYLPDFTSMVSQVESLFTSLALPTQTPLGAEHVDFTMELGLIHPLFHIALKCRDAAVRRRAIECLKRAGKEGVWEGPVMAVLARRVVGLEEMGVRKGEVVPERNRFAEVKRGVDYEGRRVVFEARKRVGSVMGPSGGKGRRVSEGAEGKGGSEGGSVASTSGVGEGLGEGEEWFVWRDAVSF